MRPSPEARVWGPLHGLPMTVKDSYDVAGLPTTWGVPELRDNVPTTNAVAVDRLLAAGAVIFGKTNIPYNLADFQSYNDIYGTTNNPWDLERVPGGSSGGAAAALAAGLTGLEAGSDIGGSIRNPAHYCGVYGHKATWGVLPLRGHAKPGVLAPTDISVIGPLARDAGDLALAVDVMAGPDRIEANGWKLELPRPEGRGPGDWRIAVWADDPFCPVDHAVRDAVLRAADALRAMRGPASISGRPARRSSRRKRKRSTWDSSRPRSPHATATRSSGRPWNGWRGPRRRGHPPRATPPRGGDAPSRLDPHP